MKVRWERYVRLKEPLMTPEFLIFAGLAAIALLLGLYRELRGLGYVTALNDGYSWGMFKNWNVTTLTALGSGGYAVAVLTWIFNQRKYHPIMRTAVLTSLLGYGTGMLSLGFDVGRPWNFVMLANPRTWNPYSVLLEVAICMTAYFMLALDVENMPPFLERMYKSDDPAKKEKALKIFRFMQRTFPFGIAIAFILPTMHQSSLGSLMYLAGNRVNVLWQTPFLPLLYLLMAYILGFAFVIMVLMLSSLTWDLGFDMNILGGLARVMSFLTLGWLVIQFADLSRRGVLGDAFTFGFFSRIFLLETVLLLIPAVVLQLKSQRTSERALFHQTILLATGGILYRFTPTTVAFDPLGDYKYFPSVFEILMAVGFSSLGVALYIYFVKTFAILPAPAGKVVGEPAVKPFNTL